MGEILKKAAKKVDEAHKSMFGQEEESMEVQKLKKQLAKSENTVKSLKGELKTQPDWEREYNKVLEKYKKRTVLIAEQGKKVEELERDVGSGDYAIKVLEGEKVTLEKYLSQMHADEEVKAFAARHLGDLDVYLVTYTDENDSECEVYVLADCISHAEDIFIHKLHPDAQPISIARTQWKVLMPNINPVHRPVPRKEED
jgi:hypothetical protein